MENSRVMQSMLLDFYGQLLTEKQRECFDLHFNEDLSLSEIAEQSGISRQGVWDNIRRAEATLRELEEKTGLVGRVMELERELEETREELRRLKAGSGDAGRG
jgi:predicted DNA-binding protein YlxM (UPF0122 family)